MITLPESARESFTKLPPESKPGAMGESRELYEGAAVLLGIESPPTDAKGGPPEAGAVPK